MLLSDLHLEYEDTVLAEFPVLAPILILARDIGRPDCPSLQTFLFAQFQRFEHIFYVAGNHCFYDGIYEERLEQLQQLDNLHPRIHFLQNKTYLLANKVCLLGIILWSYVRSEAALTVGQCHYDYQIISTLVESQFGDENIKTSRLITVDDTNHWHAQQHLWLTQEIQKARDNQEHVVIITHHAPCRANTLTSEEVEEGVEDTYANDHETDCVAPVRLWLHEHTHRSTDFPINSTRIVSNQHGLFGENCGFRPNMKITLYDDGTVFVKDVFPS